MPGGVESEIYDAISQTWIRPQCPCINPPDMGELPPQFLRPRVDPLDKATGKQQVRLDDNSSGSALHRRLQAILKSGLCHRKEAREEAGSVVLETTGCNPTKELPANERIATAAGHEHILRPARAGGKPVQRFRQTRVGYGHHLRMASQMFGKANEHVGQSCQRASHQAGNVMADVATGREQ